MEINVVTKLATPKIIKVRKFADMGRTAISLKRPFKHVIDKITHVMIKGIVLPVRKSDYRVETTSLPFEQPRFVVTPLKVESATFETYDIVDERISFMPLTERKQNFFNRFVSLFKRK